MVLLHEPQIFAQTCRIYHSFLLVLDLEKEFLRIGKSREIQLLFHVEAVLVGERVARVDGLRLSNAN